MNTHSPSFLTRIRIYKCLIHTNAITLLETMVAVSVFGLVILGVIPTILYIQKSSRTTTEFEIALDMARERLELIKSLSYTQIKYSTSSVPVYLRIQNTSQGIYQNEWRMPDQGTWENITIRNDNGIVINKPELKTPKWTVSINSVTTGASPTWNFKQVTVSLKWKSPRDNTSAPWRQVNLETSINAVYPNL